MINQSARPYFVLDWYQCVETMIGFALLFGNKAGGNVTDIVRAKLPDLG